MGSCCSPMRLFSTLVPGLLLWSLLGGVAGAQSPSLHADTYHGPGPPPLQSGPKMDRQSGPQLGQPLSDEVLDRLPRPVFYDGQGLPPGQGDAAHGAVLYAAQCATCHGDRGQGARAMELVGDRKSLTTDWPDRGIAVFWPYAPTLFDYVYRAMPPARPASLSVDEVYSLLAHLLVLNGVWQASQPLTPEALADLRMPNRQGFHTRAR